MSNICEWFKQCLNKEEHEEEDDRAEMVWWPVEGIQEARFTIRKSSHQPVLGFNEDNYYTYE